MSCFKLKSIEMHKCHVLKQSIKPSNIVINHSIIQDIVECVWLSLTNLSVCTKHVVDTH